MTVHICNVIESRDGKIYREREYFDMANILAQLGVTQLPTYGASARAALPKVANERRANVAIGPTPNQYHELEVRVFGKRGQLVHTQRT